MFLIVGLGNPGERYEFNRHNIGYRIIDAFASELGLGDWKKQGIYHNSEILNVEHMGHKAHLMKPGTFMNNSGVAVHRYLNDKHLETENLWVIQDETEVPFGEVRVKFGGSSAGHNGINSIDQEVGSGYWRIRVGVGRPTNDQPLSDYVLSNFTAQEFEQLGKVIDQVVAYLIKSLEEGTITSQTFNAKEN
ncbi:aminoacyl-tRNA hydrolase [Candidatus Berkelbacteria bacterium]|nr:aminoacyl-tRNA hydrolase [Candidatus Berkelbacteria bacterium]